MGRVHRDRPQQEHAPFCTDADGPVADGAEDAAPGIGDEAEVVNGLEALAQAVGGAGQAVRAEGAVKQGFDLRAVLRPLATNGKHDGWAFDDRRAR